MARVQVRRSSGFVLGLVALASVAACSNATIATTPPPSGAASPTTIVATPVTAVPTMPGSRAGTVVETSVPGFILTSPSFAQGGAMDAKFTCTGGDTSPALHWVGAPAATQSFALIVTDPDASNFVHWVAYDIPGGASGDLAEGIKDGGPPIQAMNSFGANGYRGPCPPSGTHHYVFTLYALADRFTLANRSNPTADDVRTAMEGQILARTTLTGTYTAAG